MIRLPRCIECLILFLGFSAAMGIGRFVFTPILPSMKESLHMSYIDISLITTLNFIGYFFGALFLLIRPSIIKKNTLVMALLLSSISLLLTPLLENEYWFCIIRFLSGFFSSVAFVCLASRALIISKENQIYGSAFGGVGFGIIISGLIPSINQHWESMWYISSFISLILSMPIILITDNINNTQEKTKTKTKTKTKRGEIPILISYFLEGAGYIIVGSYIVSIITEESGVHAGILSWVIVGLITIPSIMIWSSLTKKIKPTTILVVAYLLQLISPILLVISNNISLAYISASLFGLTFMGITKLSMQEANLMGVENSSSKMTLSYSAGQIFGPLISSPFIKNSYHNAFVVSSIFIGLCVVFCIYLSTINYFSSSYNK